MKTVLQHHCQKYIKTKSKKTTLLCKDRVCSELFQITCWGMLLVTLDIRPSTQIALEFQLQTIHNLEQFILLHILKMFLEIKLVENIKSITNFILAFILCMLSLMNIKPMANTYYTSYMLCSYFHFRVCSISQNFTRQKASSQHCCYTFFPQYRV